MSNDSKSELKRTISDQRWWERIFRPLGCVLTGWTYRNTAQVRLPSGAYLEVDSKVLELIECCKNAAARTKQSEENQKYLSSTRLVEEVPGVPEHERYYLWRNRKVEAHFPTRAAGVLYCTARGIIIDEYEPFEP